MVHRALILGAFDLRCYHQLHIGSFFGSIPKFGPDRTCARVLWHTDTHAVYWATIRQRETGFHGVRRVQGVVEPSIMLSRGIAQFSLMLDGGRRSSTRKYSWIQPSC